MVESLSWFVVSDSGVGEIARIDGFIIFSAL